MASRGLKKKPTLEDVIGEGVSVRVPQRPYTQLADDPRVLAYSTLGQDPAAWRDLELRLHAARRFHDEVRWAVMSRERELGAHMAAHGLGGKAPVPDDAILGDHDRKVEASLAADEAARQETIARHQASIERNKRMAEEEMNHPHSKSAVEQSRSEGYGVDKGPMETAGESIGSVTGFVANRAGSGYRSATSDDLAQRGGATIFGGLGRAVDTAASNAISAGKTGVDAFILDDLLEPRPPKEIPTPKPRLRPRRDET